MSGNVWEWCWDPSDSSRHIRGGSWDYFAFSPRVSLRYTNVPDDRYFDFGFRPARSSVP
jgi:formylglycine-generating enzyme required for sulfatase activity